MDSELIQVQQKSLEIFDIVRKICDDNQIKYSLCGGSVVGAHLYKGFLPWDDDIDIMMTREHYNRFITIADKSLPKGFVLMNYQKGNDPQKSKINFSKVVNENTTLIENSGNILGIFIDIIVYDKIPENPLKYIDIFLFKRAMTINRGKIHGKSLKNRFRNLILSTILCNRKKYLMFFQKMVELIAQTSSNYTYRELFGAYYKANLIPFNPSIFENYTLIEFEGRQVMIVRDYIDYLQTRYNRTDFREPKEKQVPIHYRYVNFQKSYREIDSDI